MRGSPLVRAILAFLVILAMGVPLWRLTRPASEVSAPAPAVEPPHAAAIHLQLDFTAPPASVKVISLGKEVWNATAPASGVEQDLPIEFPKEGVDLQFDVDWSGDALSAMRVRLRDPEGREMEKSVWGRGKTSEVLTFP